MEHVEHAGIHSGDSACALPPRTLDAAMQEELMRQTRMLARELGVVGLINVQFAIFEGEVYILEVNPRASRTIPFVSKAIGVPLAKLAALVMAGKKLADLGFTAERVPDHVSVKESVFPFVRFPGVDTILGPEMKSTGEVMGIERTFAMAFAKAELAASTDLPADGWCSSACATRTSALLEPIARGLSAMGFELVATGGTARHIQGLGIPCAHRQQGRAGSPHVVDLMREEKIAMVINTPDASGTADSFSIRRTALEMRLPFCTTMAGAQAAVEGIAALRDGRFEVRALQDYHSDASQTVPIADDRRRKTAAHNLPPRSGAFNFPADSRAMPLEMQTPLSALERGRAQTRRGARRSRYRDRRPTCCSTCRCITRTGARARRLRNSRPRLLRSSKAASSDSRSGRCAGCDGGGWRPPGSKAQAAREFAWCGSTCRLT